MRLEKIFLVLLLLVLMIQVAVTKFEVGEFFYESKELANSLFTDQLLPFEILSILLTAVLIGALRVAMKEVGE